MSATGTALLYSTYLGGSGLEDGLGIAVDGSGNAYVTGVTGSTDFPIRNTFQPLSGGPDDGFVAELNPSLFGGASLVYSSYLGGSGLDYGTGVAVDGSGNAYITGVTTSSNFPTKNPFQALKKAGNGPSRLRDQDHGKLRPCEVATNPRADDGPDTAYRPETNAVGPRAT